MQYLDSIETLTKENIIATQNRPIIAHCSDLNYYYCKYHNGIGSAYRLFKEYLISQFLTHWNLQHAKFSFINILTEHIEPTLGIQRRCFSVPCFGSLKIQNAETLTQVNEDVLLSPKSKKEIKSALITLSFFDILFANEDRHAGNYNILFSILDGKYHIIPIDHEACFNHQNLNRELTLLNYEETLIYSPIFNKLFNSHELSNKIFLDTYKKNFYLCYRKCVDSIDEFVAQTPAAWSIPLDQIALNLKHSLTDKWFETCWKEFLVYLQMFISNTQ